MTIALLTNRFPPEIDGVGDYTAYLAAELARRGDVVHVICRKQASIAAPEHVTVHAVVERWDHRAGTAVCAVLEAIRPDWVVLQYVPYGFQALGMPLLLPGLLRQIRALGIRTGVMFHEVRIRPVGIKGRIVSGVQRHIAGQLCRHADAVLTSIDFYRALLAPFRTDVRVLPVGANIEVTPLPEADRQHLRQQLFHDKRVVVATFGRRDISALAQAVDRVEGAGLLVLGGPTPNPFPRGEGRGVVARRLMFSLIKLVSNLGTNRATRGVAPLPSGGGGGGGVTTGPLPAAQIGTLLQCVDLFVLPDPVTPAGEGGTSLKSGSLAAALAAGLPVIGVRGDMSEPPLRHGENIWLTEQTDAEGLCAAIRTLLDDPSLRERLRRNGHALYRERMTWAVIAAGYREMLASKIL